MKLVEACGKMINTEYITSIGYNLDDGRIEITMLNGNIISFPVLDREEYEEILRKLDPTQDTSIIDCAKKIKKYCRYGNCGNCVFHSKGRCFTQPEIEDNYYNEEPEPIFPLDWDLD